MGGTLLKLFGRSKFARQGTAFPAQFEEVSSQTPNATGLGPGGGLPEIRFLLGLGGRGARGSSSARHGEGTALASSSIWERRPVREPKAEAPLAKSSIPCRACCLA